MLQLSGYAVSKILICVLITSRLRYMFLQGTIINARGEVTWSLEGHVFVFHYSCLYARVGASVSGYRNRASTWERTFFKVMFRALIRDN